MDQDKGRNPFAALFAQFFFFGKIWILLCQAERGQSTGLPANGSKAARNHLVLP